MPEVKRYRKRPVEVEAVQVSDVIKARSWNDLPEWLSFAYEEGWLAVLVHDEIEVDSQDGKVTAEWNDWLIYEPESMEPLPTVCRADIFEATYEEVRDA